MEDVQPSDSEHFSLILRNNHVDISGSGNLACSNVQSACCGCSVSANRCGTPTCPCFRRKSLCTNYCESNRYRGDCLNQAVCRCTCQRETPGGPSSTTSPPPGNPAKGKSICAKAEKCECLRLRESCNPLCRCQKLCKNKESKKSGSSGVLIKSPKLKDGCSCARSKRSCLKDCPCRAALQFCGPKCRCKTECTNCSEKFQIPKHTQACFLEQKTESSSLIATFRGDDYLFRMDIYRESKGEPHVEEQLAAAMHECLSKHKLDIQEITIFISKSPCFHQDCEPRCEVIENCSSNRACSKILAVLLNKLRKELGRVDIRLTVKFLFPHLHRGDLYTKQGILFMMQNGINVEPLLVKEWSAIMDWSQTPEHKLDHLKLWSEHELDKAVAQSQGFINECRRAMGLSMKFWVAEIHEIIKNTVFGYTEIRYKLKALTDGLKHLDLTATPHTIRSTPSKRRSFLDMAELRDRLLSYEFRKPSPRQELPTDDPELQRMVASLCGRSFDDQETNEIAQRIRCATSNIKIEIDSLLEFLNMKGG